MKIKKGFVIREVAGENIAVPTGERAKYFRGMIKLNSTAKFMWDFFLEEHTEDEAVKALLAEYDVGEDDAIAGVRSFVKTATDNGFME